MYYRPEEWDVIDADLLDYLEDNGLMPAFVWSMRRMRDAWRILDDNGVEYPSSEDIDSESHPGHLWYELAYNCAFRSEGAFYGMANCIRDEGVANRLCWWARFNPFY